MFNEHWFNIGSNMKLLTFKDNSANNRIAQLLDDAQVQPLAYPDGSVVLDLVELIKSAIPVNTLKADGNPLAYSSIQLLAPIPKPARNLFCVGKNYINHAQEFTKSGFDAGQTAADAIPTDPIIFSKTPETIIANGQRVWDAAGVTDSLDYEAELAVIIGKAGRGISKDKASDHVWGYTILNDVTARDWQKRHKQWHLGKSFDTFGPMGPVVVTSDEIDGANLDLKCWINGE